MMVAMGASTVWWGRAGDALRCSLDDGDLVVPSKPPVVIDSWLLDRGMMRGLDRHRTRFVRSCAAVGADPVAAAAQFDRLVGRLPSAGRWFPRVELLEDRATYLVRQRACPPLTASVRVLAEAVPDERSRPEVKGYDLSWLDAVRRHAHDEGADEALLCDRDGNVVEGASTAVLWWEGDALCVPTRSTSPFWSITRSTLEDMARKDGIEVRAVDRAVHELHTHEVWVCNSLHGPRVVSEWADGRRRVQAAAADHAEWVRSAIERIAPEPLSGAPT